MTVPAGTAPGAGLAAVSDALRSGAEPTEAWHRVGVIVRDGVPTATSVRAVTGDDALAAAVLAASRLARELGASPAPVLDLVLRSADEDADASVRRATALAGPAASARVLSWLPALGLVLGFALGANPLAVLLDPGRGLALLAGGVGADLLGRWWSGRLVRDATVAGQPPRARTDGTPAMRRRSRAITAGRRVGSLVAPAPTARPALVPVPVVLDLLAAASESGAPVPRCLASVGAAVGGDRGLDLAEAGAEISWGASWAEAWAGRDDALAPVASALRPAWEDGSSPVAAARAAARAVRRGQQTQALVAAERLGVRLLLPLTLCHLPAFVLLGIIPVLVSFVGHGGPG